MILIWKRMRVAADVRWFIFCEIWGTWFSWIARRSCYNSILKAKRGLQITAGKGRHVAEILEDLLECDGRREFILLIKHWSHLGCKQIEPRLQMGFKHDFMERETCGITISMIHTLINFKNDRSSWEIVRCQYSPIFLRIFKSKNKKTIRISWSKRGGSAEIAIIERPELKQFCYESGFNNFTSFHKYFKLITGKSIDLPERVLCQIDR